MRIATFKSRRQAAAATRGPRSRRASALPPVPCSLPTSRRGISLLEVLISMFVLLFGLMGVAAVFPVGNHYATKSEKYDRDIALVDAAFSELATRGMLQPDRWLYASVPRGVTGASATLPLPVIQQNDIGSRRGLFSVPIPVPTNPNAAHPGYAFIIDPLGTAAAIDQNVADAVYFPFYDANQGPLADPARSNNWALPDEWRRGGAVNGLSGIGSAGWPIVRVGLDINPLPGVGTTTGNRVDNANHMSSALAAAAFRLHDDLTVSLPREDDRPGVQPWILSNNGTALDHSDDFPLARQYNGAYSWIATVVPGTADDFTESSDALESLQPATPGYGQKYYDVSVAVFYKRAPLAPSAESERSIKAELQAGGELLIYNQGDPEAVDAAVQDLFPGGWIAVAGVVPQTGKSGVAASPGPGQLLIKWYRILSLDDETLSAADTGVAIHNPTSPTALLNNVYYRRAVLDGPAWPNVAGLNYIPGLRALIMPGVIGVTTRSLPMEVPSPWSVQHYPLPPTTPTNP